MILCSLVSFPPLKCAFQVLQKGNGHQQAAWHQTQKTKIQNVLAIFNIKKKHEEGSIIYDRKISDHNIVCFIKQITLFEGK
jgi:hypothetical protein